MRLLLDTHVFLWVLNDDPLSAAARRGLQDPAALLFVSVASLWEIVIKHRIGKIDVDIAAIMAEMAPASKLQWLGITVAQLETVDRLPVRQGHKDPFDHLIVAQAITEGLTLVTRDRNASLYPVPILAA